MVVKAGYKKTEIGVIPEDWKTKPLIGLAAILHGFGFQSLHFKPFGKFRLTTPGHFHENGGFRDVGDKQKFYDGPVPHGYLLNEGDLIVAMTEQADGLLGSGAFVPTGGTYLHNQRLGKVKILSPELSLGFLYLLLNSKTYRAKVRETAAGTKVKHTSPTRLLEIPVALPPTKAEQEAIAETLSDADALIESLEEFVAKKRQIKHGAMQELLTGKKRLPGFTGKWQTKSLGYCGEVIMGQSPPGSTYNRTGAGSPLINGPTEFTERHPIKIQWTTQPARFCKRGDLLICVRGSSTGRTNYADDTYAIGRGVAAIRAKDQNDTEYLSYQVISGVSEILAAATGSTFPSVDGASFRKIVVPLPPPNEQRAIADLVSDMDAEIVALEAKLAKVCQIKQGMMQELLTGRIRLV